MLTLSDRQWLLRVQQPAEHLEVEVTAVLLWRTTSQARVGHARRDSAHSRPVDDHMWVTIGHACILYAHGSENASNVVSQKLVAATSSGR
jgi:hypothetical protein